MNSNIMSQLSTNAVDTKYIVDRTKTGTTLVACTCLVLLAMTPHAASGTAEDPATKMQRIEEEKRDALRQLRSVEQKHPENREIQMGLAFLYQQCATGEEPFKESKRQLERALALDPAYKAAWATLAMDTATFTISKGRHLVDGLEGMINNAKGRGATEIYIGTSPPMNLMSRGATQHYTPRGSLYEALSATFGGKAGKALVIEEKDYNRARGQVRNRVESEMSEALTVVEQAETHDPQNALYGYLKVHLRFELGQPTLALKELKAAVGKPFLQTYLEERQNSVAKALEVADAPATLKSHIKPFNPIGDYMQILIWRRHIEPLAIKSEKEGNHDQAKEIYQLSIGMAKHIRQEPSPHNSEYSNMIGQAMERWAHEHLADLAKRGGPSTDSPGRAPGKE